MSRRRRNRHFLTSAGSRSYKYRCRAFLRSFRERFSSCSLHFCISFGIPNTTGFEERRGASPTSQLAVLWSLSLTGRLVKIILQAKMLEWNPFLSPWGSS